MSALVFTVDVLMYFWLPDSRWISGKIWLSCVGLSSC